MSDPPILVSAGIELQPLDDSAINRVVDRFRDRVDEMLRDIEQLRTDVTITTDVDTQPVEEASRLIDSLDAEAVFIPLTVDDGELNTANNRVMALDNETITIPVDMEDSELDGAQRKVEDLDAETVTIPTDVEDSELRDALKQIQTVQIMHVAIEVLQGAEGIPVVGGLIGGINDAEQAVRTFEASTGEAVGGAADIIDTLYTEAWAGTRTEIARVVALAQNLGVPDEELEATARSALETAAAIEGITGEAQNANQILRSQQQLVSLGLAPSYQRASDIIIAGFQSTIGASGDFLGDLGEFAPTFAELGFNADQMLTTLETGLAGGVDNISRMSEGLISFNELASGMDEGFVTALQTLDEATGTNLVEQLDLFNAGQLGGAEFMGSVLNAVRNFQPSGDMPTVQGILGSLFGGTATNIGAQALLNIDPIAGQFTEIEGLATTSAGRVRDTFNNAIEEITRFIEQEAITWFNESDLDLNGKMEALKEAFRTTIDEIKSGADLGEAIEVGFQIEGFDANLDRLESIFGNFILLLGDVAIAFANLTGNTQLADSIQLALAPLAEGQLAFDLQLANPDQVAAAVDAALSRGVEGADIGAAIQTAISELQLEGDFGQILNITEGLLQTQGFTPEFQAGIQQMADRVAADAQAALNTALTAGDFDMVSTIVQSLQGTELESGIQGTLIAAFDSAMAAGNLLDASAIAEQIDDPVVRTRLENTFTEYRAIADAAFAEGEFGVAQDLYTLIGDTERAQEALEGLRNSVFQPSGGAGAPSGGPVIGPTTSGNIAGGSIFEQAMSAVQALEQAFTEKEPVISGEIDTVKTGLLDLDESAAADLTSISENFALFAGQIDSEISRVDPRLRGVQEQVTRIKTTSEADLPLANEAFETFTERFLEGTEPILERVEAIVLGFGDVIDVSNGLPGVSGGGSGSDTPSRDDGGWIHQGEMYMVNGEPFLAPGDALALGLDAGSNLMGLFSGGGGVTTYNSYTTNVQVQQSLHAQSTAQAISAGDRFAAALRGF